MAACLEIQYKELCKVNGLGQGDEFVACQNQLLQRGTAAKPCKHALKSYGTVQKYLCYFFRVQKEFIIFKF